MLQKALLERTLRALAAQGLVLLPDVLNWVGVAVLPAIPPPWNLVAGAVLNGLGSALRRKDETWKWLPV